MPCRHRHLAMRVLTGDLPAGKSTGMLEHFRVCGDCRGAFDFAAQTISRTASGRGDGGEPGEGLIPVAGSFVPGSWPSPVRRNRRTLLVFGVAILAMVVAGVGRGRRGDVPSEPAAQDLWRRALSEGTPVVQAPSGACPGRPRVVTALVPPGSSGFRVVIRDGSGRTVLEREVKPGEDGCFLDEASIDAPAGAFRAARLMLPFPDHEALPIQPGQPLGVQVVTGGGHGSSASVFQIADAPLHDGPPEGR